MDLTRPPGLYRAGIAALGAWLVSGLVAVTDARAEVYKCQDANGRTQYSDRRCPAGRAMNYVPPQLTPIESDKLTGGRRADAPPKGIRKWLPKPLDPVADCRARGGEIDKEMRACRLP